MESIIKFRNKNIEKKNNKIKTASLLSTFINSPNVNRKCKF